MSASSNSHVNVTWFRYINQYVVYENGGTVHELEVVFPIAWTKAVSTHSCSFHHKNRP